MWYFQVDSAAKVMTETPNTCWAPRAPEGCEGSVSSKIGAPVCAAHERQLVSGTGAWTVVGAREWLTAAISIYEAHVTERLAREFVPQSEGFGQFKWIGGSPGWNSNDSHERVCRLTPSSKKPGKHGKNRWNPKAWWMRKKKKAGA